MAPIKFEDNIKEKLEQRQIQPSSQAWEALSAKLDANDNKSSRNKYWWLGIAASFVGVLLVSVWLMQGTADSSTPVMVEENKEAKDNSIQKNDSKIVVEDKTLKQIETPKNEVVKQKSIVVQEQTRVAQEQAPELNKEHVRSNNNLEQQHETVSRSVVAETPSQQKTPINSTQKSITDLKVDEVVAQIQELNQANDGVTNAEIDSLLKQAQKSIMSQRLYIASTKTVSAEQLLLEVEADSESSFRNRVFEALKSSYAKVKTAVVERNN